MKKLIGNLRLAVKLGAGFGICLLLSIIVGAASISGMNKMNDARTKMTRGAKTTLMVADFNAHFLESIRAVKNLLLSDNEADNQKFAKQCHDMMKAADEDLAEFEKTVRSEEGKKASADLNAEWAIYSPMQNKVVELGLQNKNAEAQKISIESRSSVKHLDEIISVYRAAKKKEAEKLTKESDEISQTSSELAMSLLCAAVVIGVVVATFLTRSIAGTLKTISQKFTSIKENDVHDLTRGLEALAQGNLTQVANSTTTPIALGTHDEFGKMADTFDQMLGDLQGAVGSYNQAKESLTNMVRDLAANSSDVASTSQTLAAAAEESGAASSEIASGSEKLAGSATDSAAIVQQLIAQVDTVGQSSQAQLKLVDRSGQVLGRAASGITEVAASAQQMAVAAQEGNNAVAETVEAMARVQNTVAISAAKVQELDQKGQEIGNIVVAIEQIAEQTNLLALNAAIEAARAGEHGRGFAVVADEVRKLAEEAGAATKQISGLIASVRSTVEDTVKAIEGTTAEANSGIERSEHAGKALEQILSSADQVAKKAEQVASLTQEATESMEAMSQSASTNAQSSADMSAGAAKVGSSIQEVAAISEESAAGAQELSATIQEVSSAANELARMSQDLEEIVSRFEVEGTTASKKPLKLAA